ncbi:MAG: PspC domain-containing protein [Lentimicrobiaceae bacterium]|nr:PspC domain-containing protein [Lentimicrobiaceae bacterium]
MHSRRLYRSRTSRMLGGVAGGLAEYFDIDPIIMRLVFLGLVFFGGGGVIIYIIMWIVVPENPENPFFNAYNANENPMNESQEFQSKPNFEEEKPVKEPRANQGGLMAGLILITLGVLFLVERFIPRVDFGDLWPALLIVAGIALLFNASTKTKKL